MYQKTCQNVAFVVLEPSIELTAWLDVFNCGNNLLWEPDLCQKRTMAFARLRIGQMISTELLGTLVVSSKSTDRSSKHFMTVLSLLVASGILAFWIASSFYQMVPLILLLHSS